MPQLVFNLKVILYYYHPSLPLLKEEDFGPVARSLHWGFGLFCELNMFMQVTNSYLFHNTILSPFFFYVFHFFYSVPSSPLTKYYTCSVFHFFFSAEVNAIIPTLTRSVGGSVTLYCVMSRYLRPDTNFLWRKDNEVITSRGRFSVMYSNLGRDAGQMGVKTFSRGISLTIANIEPSDTGNYTCFVNGTESSASVVLNPMGNTATTITDPESKSFIFSLCKVLSLIAVRIQFHF